MRPSHARYKCGDTLTIFLRRADHWRDCCSLRGMIRPASPASNGMAATLLIALMCASTQADAAGINLLQPVIAPQVMIVFDARQSAMDDDDAATARLDGECVAVDDPKQ